MGLRCLPEGESGKPSPTEARYGADSRPARIFGTELVDRLKYSQSRTAADDRPLSCLIDRSQCGRATRAWLSAISGMRVSPTMETDMGGVAPLQQSSAKARSYREPVCLPGSIRDESGVMSSWK